MLLILAASTQLLLVSELLLRRLLYLVLPVKRTSVQRFADNSLLSSLAAAIMQTATVPLQDVASLLASGVRVWAVLLLLAALFTTLLVLSNSSVYVYSALARIYNLGVAPAVGALKWLFILLDFVFRVFVPLWNGWVHLLSQVLRRVVLPYSFTNVDVLPELLQGLALTWGTLGQSVVTWLGNVASCTVQFEVVARECAGSRNSTRGADCIAVFSATDARCYAAPNHLAVDLLTPGLFARQAAQSLQGVIANSCGLAAIVLNLAMFPLCDYHLWAAVHGAVNTVLYTVVGMPISTWRRCEALGGARGLRPVHVKVGCTPDWQPVASMAESTLESLGNALDNWLNAAAVLVSERVSGRAHACDTSVPLKQIVLDAARAIEGLEGVEALQRLQGRGGLPEGETLRSVRVVGLTQKMFGVTDGKSVLYRSAHDGYVLAFGAWPIHVDVRLGLAAVSYGGSSADADSEGSARTGLLGCRCLDEPEFTLLCATAPYVQHIDDGLAGLNASSMHRVVFPDLLLRGMTCANTAVRVMPLRWPRRRLATTDGGGGGFAGYSRFSFRDTVNRYTGDADATDSLRLLAARERVLPSGAVEAAIYVQPVCGSENSVTCAPSERANCFPWCMAVVRGGRRAQNITMYNARKWEENVILPEVDCGVARDRGACAAAPEGKASLVDFMEQAGVVRGRCAASCTPAAVPGSVLSLVPLDAVEAEANATLRRVLEHKQRAWYAVRLAQPIVVAGDVMLGLTDDGKRLVVTRLYDIGQSTLQMASERLTLSSNAHAAEVTECATQDDTGCVARAMQEGKVVLPAAVRQVFGGAADAGVVLPAAASRWAVHWAQNPQVAVYNSLFEFCRNATPHFSLTVHSSYNRARVWTMQTMRSVDVEQDGAPSEEQTRSRVSYMRVPYFLGKQEFTERACDRVVGLQIVGVEHLNEENVLVTVLAARPRDYNPLTGKVDGARTHRYYYLHPGRSDCRRSDDEDRLENDPAIFSCWRSHASGMWPADDLITGGVWGGNANTCVRPRLMPQFGTYAVMPFVAYVRILETSLDAICSLTAIIAADPQNPTRALEELFTVQLQQSTFHATVDSAGARLLRVDDIIAAAEWFAMFNARLASFAVNALTSVSTGSAGVDKAVAGVRTLVVAGSKVYEGLPATEAPFNKVEEMFKEPIAYTGLHASVAVLTMADGIREGVLMPAIVRAFMAAQLQLVSTFGLVLRLGRVVALRLLQTIGAAADGRQAAAVSIVSAALVESRSIVENEYLDLMRFQCYGFSQMVGSERAWGQALRHMCLLLPDTLEGLMTVGSVLVLEYPVVACACKLGEGDAVGTAEDTVVKICLQRPMPAESVQWLLHMRFENPDRRDVCFAAMDSANARLHSAFDKSYKRLYQMTQHAAQVADALLALITGDTVACDAFDVSPYVLSIIPEPVDYFSSCVDTDDCLGRCYDEFTAFEQERQEMETGGAALGLDATLDVPLESLLFSLDDIEQGRHKPPFQILDAVELPREPCHAVCGQQATQSNRCVLVAGVQRQQELAVAYYCLPMDITQYVFQWPGMEAATLPPAGSAAGFATFSAPVRAVYAATSWAAKLNERDSVIVVADFSDETAPDSNFANTPAQVTRVFWCVPGLPRREILRTSLLSERRLERTARVLAAKNYLYKVEHVQVDVADSEEKDIAVRVYGFHMEARQLQQAPSNVQTWTAPVSACVRCTFGSTAALFTEAECGACFDNDAEFAQKHMRVCVRRDPAAAAEQQYADSLPCAEYLALPTYREATAGFVTKAPSSLAVMVAAGSSTQLPVPASTLSLLQNSAQNGVYMDLQKNAHARVSIVSSVVYPLASTTGRLRSIAVNSSGPAAELELITVNAQRSQGAWLHVLSLRVDAQGVNGAERGWLRATTTARVHLNCSIHSCGACAHTVGGGQLASLQQLENLCYAAQQCGIERCAGTLVNMRKPLCNLGNVVTRELHAVRVLLQGLWGAITDNIAMIVELTHERRQEYQLKWPEKLVRQEACTAKDTFVSLAATVTSVLGAFSHLMQDVSVHHGFVGSNVDSRVHARYIMVLTATTNMLASFFMWPIYQGLVLQKFFSCTANDVLYQIDTLVGDGQPSISIRFGDPRAAQAIERAGIAVCLSEDVRQSLQDAGVRVREAGQADSARSGDATALRVVRKLSDAISSTVDVGLSAHVQYAYHVMDIWLTWGASLLKGVMDVAQTVDWQNCKLPVIDSGLQSLGLCACGDEPHAIPAAEKSRTWTQHGFWCSGLLMLNEGDGSDLLVWNPYSLEQLLSLKGKKGQGYADYVLCLRGRWDEGSEHHQSTCEEYKPRDKRLDRQGVEVLQIISRCRGNYQQSRWDEASALLALFEAGEWQNLRRLFDSASARLDDKYARLRKHVVQLLDNDADLRTENALVLPQTTLECLQDALRAGMLQHDCHRQTTSFAYERAVPSEHAQFDACRVLSGTTAAANFPRFLWTGNSRNHVPLAKLHPTLLAAAERSATADKELKELLKEIDAEFEQMLSASFAQEFEQKVRVESFSTEGDELHQLIDCVVLGPYSAADLNVNVHSGNVKAPVPQYHRGNAASREFTSWGETGGSSARRNLMQNVFDFVNEKADDILKSEVSKHLLELAKTWLDEDNYKCQCSDNSRRFACCSESANNDLRLQSMIEDSLDIHDSIQAETFNQIVGSRFLSETLWTRKAGDSVPLEPRHRAAMHAVHLFANAERVPVRTYDVEDTAAALNEASLWETCTSRVAGLFATLPFTTEAVASERKQGGRTVHAPPNAFADFDPSVAYAEDRVHSLELLVDAVLERSRASAPHFWTHAHRYVASDSVWCERGNATLQKPRPEPPVTTTPTSFKGHDLRPEPVLAPGADELLYPADVLQTCPCDWNEAEGTCYVPPEVCVEGMKLLSASDALLADARSKRQGWESLCQGLGSMPPWAAEPPTQSTSFESTFTQCPAGMRVETYQLDDSSSCAAFIVTDQTIATDPSLCNCHKFADKVIQVGGVNGFPKNLQCVWKLSANTNITIQGTHVKARLGSLAESFFVTNVQEVDVNNVDQNNVLYTSLGKPNPSKFTITTNNYMQLLFQATSATVSSVNKGVDATWSLPSGVRCVSCDPGQYSPSVTSDISCLACERGKYSATFGATACTDCPVGFYQPSTGRTSCLSGVTYKLRARAEQLLVLQMFQQLPASMLQNCSARRLSTAWGLLAPEDEGDWYSGNSTRGAWRVSAQHLATFGPGGLRVGMLSREAPESMQEYVRAFELGERLEGTFNARTGHTIAQPVCNGTLREHLTDDLRRYFPDVFVPMAHAVQIVPPVEYCARWALEHAMSYVLRRVAEAVELPQEQLDLQQSTARTWRDRCAAQMHEVGLCTLRGVYDIVPADVPASTHPPAACAFAGPAHSVSGCARLYYTKGCLLYCDGAFYDPCLCGEGACAPRPFAPGSCAAGRLQDGRQLLHDDEVLLTSSMTLPADILPREAANDSHWLALRQSLAQAQGVSKLEDVDFDTLFARSAAALAARADEEGTPHSYCDDLFDYWPDVQHPVGYHPSTACSADASRIRGFDAWMSRNASGHAVLDPVRMRNMTLASQAFGAAHLVCDAHAYAAPGHRLNPYYMQSRWDAQAHADPAVPVPAQEKTIEEMPTLGRPSFAATDTTLRGQGHSAERLMEHSVGLVRAWAQWFPLPDGLETAAAQELLDTRWPHWLPDETVRSATVEHGGLFLGDSASPPPGCRFPRLQRCRRDDECGPAGSSGFRCLLNFNEDENTRRGVCMPASSCYQHKHCPSGRLCSGEGSCVAPQLFVLNKAGWDSEIQLFSKGCNVSMRRLSRFESVADFARANGMCSFRDWYHYKNATAGAPALDYLKSVPNRLVKRTDLGDGQSLEGLAVLKTLSHPCDRSYAHTDLGACFLEGRGAARVSALGSDSSYAATSIVAARTWQLKEGAWHARFCALQGGEKSGFLSPFPDNTLRSAARDIQRCSKLGLCPSTSFHVRGKAVEGRRVRVHRLSEDSPNGVAPSPAARDYCSLDAQRCWGMGFLLGQDCAEVDEERSALCVVDELVLPLLPIVYNLHIKRPVTRADFGTRLAELRKECVDAFTHTVNGKQDATLFEDVFQRLSQPYAWTDAALRQQVLEYANGLFLQLFGVTQDSDTRGFASVDKYLQHSRCATYIARALAENEERIAKDQTRDRIQFYQSSGADQPLLSAAPVLPGASLYLFDRRLPVSVNLRWMLQCVVFAKGAADGGASASFPADLNSGRLSATRDVVDCANYIDDNRDTQPVKLHVWLRRAKFLFTQVPSRNLHPQQVSADVYASIARAIAQLPVLGIPDLTCVSAPEGWQQNTFARQNALANLNRFRNTALNFDVQAQTTSIDSTQRIFADAGESSVYEQVLEFLVKGTTRAGQPWTAEYPVTLQELETAGVLENMHIYEKLVAPGDMYPRFRYANLAKLDELYKQTQIAHTLATYTLEDAQQRCKCTKEQQEKLKTLCEHRRLLKKPEYSLLNKVRCQDLRLLPCKAQGVERLLDDRRWMDTPFLAQDELLYLVLLIFQYEISYTASGGFTTLHRLRDPEQAQFVDELFGDTLPENDQLSLHEARQFNEYLERHDAGMIKCPPTELDFFQETNKRHQQLRQCRDALREQIGWGLPSGHMLTLRPQSDTLLAGFFLAHMERAGETFLDTLFDTNWTTAAHTSLEHAICSVRPEATEVMAPFWAEYFDVASDDSAAEPSLACDFEPASAGSILMVYDTLCSSSVGSPAARATCSEHPEYKDRLENLLPAVCAQQDGRVVVRRRLGALKKGRLCDMRPDGLDAACRLRHGALNGHVGEHASNLDEARVLETTQRGFWNPANTAFRGQAVGADALTALALNEDDIAGHCLAFDLDARGTLALRGAALGAACSPDAAGSDVSAWLADVGQEWAWDHALAAALHAHNESEPAAADVPWTCPLHWLQRYHDDDGRHQARSPSWQRNSARFRHLTGEHEYAHPTVRHARRLRGLRAPRFLADGLACVAPAEHCHGAEFLNRSVADALHPAWRPVAYVPAGEPECPRTLDWPADCGKATPDGDSQQPGQCVLRN